MDTLLVLAIAAVLAVGVWFLAGRGDGQTAVQDKTIEVMIELTKKDEAFTKLPKVGDTVTVFGINEGMELSCDRIAKQVGTIPYEVLCAVNKRIPRIYLSEGKPSEVLQYIV